MSTENAAYEATSKAAWEIVRWCVERLANLERR